MTIIALLGLMAAESAALVIAATPLLGGLSGTPLFVGCFAGAWLLALKAGPVGVRYVAQALLAAIHLGLLGSALLLLYLAASNLGPLPPYGALALIGLPALCAVLLAYRQSKYVEPAHLVPLEETSSWRRLLGRQVRLLQRLINVVISVLAATVAVIGGMVVYFLGLPATLRGAADAFGAAPSVPALGLVAILSLAMSFPLVDAVGWRSTEVLAISLRQSGNCRAIRSTVRMVGAEVALVTLLVAALATVAALSSDLPPNSAGINDLVRHLIAFDNAITDAALVLLLVGCSAIAVSMMAMTASTAMSVMLSDILPAWDRVADDRACTSGLVLPMAGLLVVGIWILAGVPSSGLADSRFFALALAFAGLPLALLPLVLARSCGVKLPGPAASLGVLGAGAVASLACIVMHGRTDDAAWLWCAAPAGLGCGVLVAATTAFGGRVCRAR